MVNRIEVRLKSGKEFNFIVDSYEMTDNDSGVNFRYKDARFGNVPIYLAPGSIESISIIRPQRPDDRLNGGII